MKILFDQNAPAPLKRYLAHHQVVYSYEMGWDRLRNGDLLAKAEAHGFACLVTSDRNIRYQQNLSGRKIAIAVLPSGLWPEVKPRADAVVEAIDRALPGSYTEI